MKRKIDLVAQTVTFTFDDGLDPVVFHADMASKANREYAKLHGFSARIGDNAAIARKTADGNIQTITEAMRREGVVEMAQHLESGTAEWNMKSARGPSLNPTWLAIAEKRGVSYMQVAAERAAADLAELAAM
jgi:hypothetical protein